MLCYLNGTNGNAINFRGLIILSPKIPSDAVTKAPWCSQTFRASGASRAVGSGLKDLHLLLPLTPMPLGKSSLLSACFFCQMWTVLPAQEYLGGLTGSEYVSDLNTAENTNQAQHS